MDPQEFVTNVPNLSDLELAVLLSLIARQHCLVYTQDELVDDLASELALIVSEMFRLTYVIVNSEDLKSPARFGDVILDDQDSFADGSELDNDNDAVAALHSRMENVSFASGARGPAEHKLDSRLVVNVVIAKDFNMACDEVQFQVLELIDRNRIFSRMTVHRTPKTFLFLPLVSSATRHVRLNHHLNDRIFMSHYHSSQHGFPLLEEMTDVYDDSIAQMKIAEDHLIVPKEMIDHLRQLGQTAAITPEIRRYLQDVVVFLRVERDVDGGVTPYAGVNLLDLAKYLAPLHGIDFVTPSLVGLAAKKVYMHRLIISSPRRDSGRKHDHNIDASKQQLVERDPEEVIESVLEKRSRVHSSPTMSTQQPTVEDTGDSTASSTLTRAPPRTAVASDGKVLHEVQGWSNVFVDDNSTIAIARWSDGKEFEVTAQAPNPPCPEEIEDDEAKARYTRCSIEANTSQHHQQVVHNHVVSSTDAKGNKGYKKRGDDEAENLDRVAKAAGLVLKSTVRRWGTFCDWAPNAKTEMATIAIDRIKRSGRLDHILINEVRLNANHKLLKHLTGNHPWNLERVDRADEAGRSYETERVEYDPGVDLHLTPPRAVAREPPLINWDGDLADGFVDFMSRDLEAAQGPYGVE
ncbi:hypothetical protein DV737_g1000, partial [Chaetothyriales sp. CBS 132003]